MFYKPTLRIKKKRYLNGQLHRYEYKSRKFTK